MKDRYGTTLLIGDYVEVESIRRSFIAVALEEVKLAYGKRIKIAVLNRPNACYYYSSSSLTKKEPEELI